MERFHIIDDGAVIVRTKGVYKQVKLYRRGAGIYANIAGGFVRLYKGGGTGVPSINWDDVEIPGAETDPVADAHGKLSLPYAIKTIEAK